MLITHDGEMANCCEDLTGAFGLGNVHEHSIEALWFSDAHVRIVQDLVAGRRAGYTLCRSCPQMPTAGLPDGARIVMRPRAAVDAVDHPVDRGARVATP
jgi:radical SAM protein with 4Fe4S-binding SPASM domain